jgi:diaminohydroxyphosphoribosylaminopyrimidine deaminase/5-amino-6-(5-phosphoribosylamino)uracil reductase
VINSVKEEIADHVHFIKTEKNNFLQNLMEALYKEQIQSVIIEGGKFTLQQFIDANLWDEAIVITNEHLLLENGTQAPVFDQSNPFKTEIIRDNRIDFFFQKTFKYLIVKNLT